MKNATQDKLACYIARTGCGFEISFQGDGVWLNASAHPPDAYIHDGYTVRIALTPFGLPSHLQPHNPAGLSAEKITEGGKYRAVTVGEDLPDTARWWSEVDKKWHGYCDAYKVGDMPRVTYRLPAATPFPDLEEMSSPLPGFPDPSKIVDLTSEQQEAAERVLAEELRPPQPAPGETPTGIPLFTKDEEISLLEDYAKDLERQRDQAIREISEQGRRIGELEVNTGCHYCKKLLDATAVPGLYECRSCVEQFKNAPNGQWTVDKMLSEIRILRGALKDASRLLKRAGREDDQTWEPGQSWIFKEDKEDAKQIITNLREILSKPFDERLQSELAAANADRVRLREDSKSLQEFLLNEIIPILKIEAQKPEKLGGTNWKRVVNWLQVEVEKHTLSTPPPETHSPVKQ